MNENKTQRSSRFTRLTSQSSVSRLTRSLSKSSYRSYRNKGENINSKKSVYIWVLNDKQLWILCKILNQELSHIHLQNIETNETFTIDSSFSVTCPSNDNVLSDMAALKNLNEPSILHNLTSRYNDMITYTFMGLVLIAMNPFRYYPSPSFEDFIGKSLNPENPHPYAISGLYVYLLKLF